MANTFQELIQLDKAVLVDFYAEWCGPCKVMAPILQDVKLKLGDKVTILKIDIDKNRPAAERFQIEGVPTLILFRKGEIKWRHSGVVEPRTLENLINEYG